MKRRQILAGLSLTPATARWATPVVLSVVLPTHAQSTAPCFGIVPDSGGRIQEHTAFSCESGVATLRLETGQIAEQVSPFLVQGMTLSNPAHQLIEPTVFPFAIGSESSWLIEIRETGVDCSTATSMSPGTLSLGIAGCASPLVYDVGRKLRPLR